jgi:hypothetical protein
MAAINQFKIISQGRQIETYDNFDISLTYQIDDIEDISTKKSSYSKTILIPGTPNNNDFFQNIFEINIDISDTNFNPKKSLPTQILIGDEMVFYGNLQLLNIVTNQKMVEYEVVITGLFKNIIGAFSDYYIDQLNFDEFSHYRNVNNIINSFDNKIFVNSILTQESPGVGYIYPLTVTGNNSVSNRTFNAFDLNPGVYAKTIMDKMFKWAGYTYESQFFNSDYFKALIIPTETPTYDSINIDDRTIRIGLQAQFGFWYMSNALNNGLESNWWGSPSVPQVLLDLCTALSPMLKKSNTWYRNSNNGYWYVPYDLQSGVFNQTVFQDPSDEWKYYTNGQPQTTEYTASVSGFYQVDVKSSFQMYYRHQQGSSFRYNSGTLSYKATIVKVAANGSQTDIVSTNLLSITPPLANSTGRSAYGNTTVPGTGYMPGWWLSDQEYSIDMNVGSVWLNAGDKIRIKYELLYPTSISWASNTDQVLVAAVMKPLTNGGAVNKLEVKPATNVNYNVNALIYLSPILPTIKMRDFFINIVKMFNLVVSDDPNIPNNLIIEPRDQYFETKQLVKDWTLKLDYDQDVIQTPMSELDVKSYYFTYDQDNDFYNKSYEQQSGRIYGDIRIDFLNEFSTTDKEIKLDFAPTPVSDNYISPCIAPFFCDIDTNSNFKPLKQKPRILFSKKLQSTKLIKYRNSPGDTGTISNQYVYAGMYDDPTDPDYTLEWGNSTTLYYNTSLCCPDNNLVNQFYLSTLNDITDINAKLLEAYFHLTPSDLNQFDFRDIIFIDNAYWRVNTIVDYNPNAIDKTTKVILYKLNDIDIFYNDNKNIPGSQIDCPTDIVIKKTKFGWIFVSPSGNIITEDCCDQWGGYWTNGYCQAKKPIINDPGTPWGDQTGMIPIGSSGIAPEFQAQTGGIYTERPFPLTKNQNIINSNTVIVQGADNYVDSTAENVFVLGEGNSVNSDTRNAFIIGNNHDSITSDTIVVGNLVLNSDGLSYYYPTITDAGYETVMYIGKTNLIDIIDGTYESVRNYGGDSKLRPVIDGSDKQPPVPTQEPEPTPTPTPTISITNTPTPSTTATPTPTPTIDRPTATPTPTITMTPTPTK